MKNPENLWFVSGNAQADSPVTFVKGVEARKAELKDGISLSQTEDAFESYEDARDYTYTHWHSRSHTNIRAKVVSQLGELSATIRNGISPIRVKLILKDTDTGPSVDEYFASGQGVYATRSDGSESFVMDAGTARHAEAKASKLNSRL